MDWDEYKMYPDVDNKFLVSVAEQYRWNKYISKKQDEVCWNILMSIRLSSSLYKELHRK